MAATKGHGNPKWTRDETIIALDLYFDCAGIIPSGTDERVIEVSRLLRSLPYHDQAARRESFRNPDGVAFKLQNIRQLATGKGLGNVSKMDRIIWGEFGKNPEAVKKLADLIRTGIKVAALEEDEGDGDIEFVEGRIVTEVHKKRERNPKLRKRLIEIKRKKGPLKCEICGCVEPAKPYDESIFEAHHVIPLAAGAERMTKVTHLALLCANCHRMLHKAISFQKRWIDLIEARSLLPVLNKPDKALE